jgi:hypothetical protein
MLTLSEGLRIAVEHDYEKNEALGIIKKDNVRILMTRFLLDRKEVLEIVDNLTKDEEDELGEII